MRVINNFLQEAKNFKKKDSVKVIIKSEDGNFLILRRQNGDGGGGQWDFPGGGIEDGENHIDAVKRETFEETNLTVELVRKIKTVSLKIPETGVNSLMHIYSASPTNINVKLKPATWKGSGGKPEHTQYSWISKKSELENLPMISQLKDILMKKLENDLKDS